MIFIDIVIVTRHSIAYLTIRPNTMPVETSDSEELIYDGGEIKKKRRTVCPFLEQFAAPTTHRTFRIMVDDSDYYMNAHWLAECSPFFDVLCFGRSFEAEKGFSRLEIVSRRDWKHFLQAMGADARTPALPIDSLNCASCLNFAHHFDVPLLKTRCIDYLKHGFCQNLPKLTRTLEILRECELASIDGIALQNVVSRLARFGSERLRLFEVHKWIKSTTIVAALFDNASRMEKADALCHDVVQNSRQSNTGVCIHRYCKETGKVCTHCQFRVCSEHQKLPCFNTADRDSGKVKWNDDVTVVMNCMKNSLIDMKDYE